MVNEQDQRRSMSDERGGAGHRGPSDRWDNGDRHQQHQVLFFYLQPIPLIEIGKQSIDLVTPM